MTSEQAIELKDKLMGTPEAMMIKWNRFNRCNAYIGVYNKRYDIIRSYTTIVGLVDKEEEIMYELGKWSPTTTKQMTTIHRQRYHRCEFVRA